MPTPERVTQLLSSASAESKIVQARKQGIDLSMTVRNMFELTPQERFLSLERGAAALKFLRGIRS